MLKQQANLVLKERKPGEWCLCSAGEVLGTFSSYRAALAAAQIASDTIFDAFDYRVSVIGVGV